MDLEDQTEGPRAALVTDTVGFVSKLPAEVSAAFKATLEEVRQADVVVHVLDASAKHLIEERAKVVNDELASLGADTTPRVLFYNKVDALDAHDAAKLRAAAADRADVVVGSARSGDLGTLKAALATCLNGALVTVHVALPYADDSYGALLSELKTRGRVFDLDHTDDATVIDATVPVDLAGRLRPYKRPPPGSAEE